MNIDAVHQKIADDEALPKAEAFADAVSDALFAYTCASESVEDCWRSLDSQGNEEAAALLRDVSQTASRALSEIDDALRDYSDAFRKLADFARPLEPRDIHGMAAVDALYALGGSAPIGDVIERVNDRLAAAEEPAWAGSVARACAKSDRGRANVRRARPLDLDAQRQGRRTGGATRPAGRRLGANA